MSTIVRSARVAVTVAAYVGLSALGLRAHGQAARSSVPPEQFRVELNKLVGSLSATTSRAERSSIKMAIIELVHEGPVRLRVSSAAWRQLESARDKAMEAKYTDAFALYEAASGRAPWWPEPYYGQGLIAEFLALSGGDAWVGEAVARYHLFLLAADSDDPRRRVVEQKLRTYGPIAEGLAEPDRITTTRKTHFGPWPYGRSALTGAMSVGFRPFQQSGNSAVTQAWADLTGASRSEKKEGFSFGVPLRLDLLVRVLPSISLGFGYSFELAGSTVQGVNTGDPDFVAKRDKLIFFPRYWEGYVRYTVKAKKEKKQGYTDFYFQAGFGRVAIDGFLGIEPGTDGARRKMFEGSGSVLSATVGADLILGNGFGLGLYSAVRVSSGAKMHSIETGEELIASTGESVSPGFSGWEILGLRLLFGL